MRLRDYQTTAVQRVRQAISNGSRAILLVAPTGSGKCLGRGTPILMFDGTIKAVEDVVIGDKIMGPDSGPRMILSTAKGRGPLYKITPTKGEPYIVNDAHILSLKITNGATKYDCSRSDLYLGGKIHNITVTDYLSRSVTFRHCAKGWRTGVDFVSDKVLPIPPYFIGLWLGDGLSRKPAVCSADREIISSVMEMASKYGLSTRIENQIDNKSVVVHITGGQCGGATNLVLTALRDLGLLQNKHIPHNYLTASRVDRLELLAGLLDTDGSLSGGGFDLIQKNKRLANEVVYLVRSLGLAAYMRSSRKICGNNGKVGNYWRISISGDCSIVPVRLTRRKAPIRMIKKNPLLVGLKVEAIGEGEYFGFEIDGDRLFLLGDFTVTHNTVCAAHILQNIHLKGNSAIFVAHRRELIKQCSDKLDKFEVPHSIMMAGESKSMMADIQVCSIQTFHSRVTKRKTSPLPDADVVILDEAHRSLSNSYLELKNHYPKAIFLGLTATPCRSDGGGLGNFYEELIEISNPRELIDLGFLVPTRIIAPRLPDLRGLKIKQGDYESEELGKRMVPMIGDMVSDWETYAKDRKTVIFAVNVAHSKYIQEQFYHNGYACEHLDGETPTDRRDEILENLKSGKTQIVTNCQVLSEGWDEPTVSCVILARPTLSYGLYLQMAGRICRPSDGKKEALIIDHAGSVYKHGFPQDSGGWELTEEVKIDKIKNERLKKEPHPVTCAECFTVYTLKENCPNCGCRPTTQSKTVMMEEGRLYEVKREAEKKELEAVLNRPREHTIVQKANFYGQLKSIAIRHRYRDGWIAHKYKERYGVWPNHPSIKNAPMLEPTQDTLNFIKHNQIKFSKRRTNDATQRAEQ